MDMDLGGLEDFIGLDLWVEFFWGFYLIPWIKFKNLILIDNKISNIPHNSINNHQLHNILRKYSPPKIIFPTISCNFNKHIR